MPDSELRRKRLSAGEKLCFCLLSEGTETDELDRSVKATSTVQEVINACPPPSTLMLRSHRPQHGMFQQPFQ